MSENIILLMSAPEENFFFPRVSMFPETKSMETLRLEGERMFIQESYFMTKTL